MSIELKIENTKRCDCINRKKSKPVLLETHKHPIYIFGCTTCDNQYTMPEYALLDYEEKIVGIVHKEPEPWQIPINVRREIVDRTLALSKTFKRPKKSWWQKLKGFMNV
jgi:hypothetical protein